MTKAILVITHNKSVRELLNSFLPTHYIIQHGESAEDWSRLRKFPDLVVVGAMRSAGEETELVRHLKSEASTSHIPVILLTQGGEAFQLQAYEANADVCLSLPFNARILVAIIHNLFRQRDHILNRYRAEAGSGSTVVNPSTASDFLTRITRCIHDNMEIQEFGVAEISLEMGLSKSTLYRKWNTVSTIELNDYIRHAKLRRAAELLSGNDLSIQEVAYKVGFSDRKYFSRVFRKFFGKSPRYFRRGMTTDEA